MNPFSIETALCGSDEGPFTPIAGGIRHASLRAAVAVGIGRDLYRVWPGFDKACAAFVGEGSDGGL